MVIALERPRAELHERIDRRVAAMFDAGLVEEVRRLDGRTPPARPVAAQAVGYREVIELLAGKFTPGRDDRAGPARSRQFAKRQTTWFRGLVEVRPGRLIPRPATSRGRSTGQAH